MCVVFNYAIVFRTYMWENFNNSFNVITHTKICVQKIISLQFTVNYNLKNRVILFHTYDKALEHIQEMHLQNATDWKPDANLYMTCATCMTFFLKYCST